MFGANYRDNPINWSLRLGRISGILVRVHLLFFLWIAFVLLQDVGRGTIVTGLVLSAMLFGIVLLHELGHCFGARSVGGDAHEILMWPLGGLATVNAPMTPRAQFITVAAGPAVNLVGCVVAALLLILLGAADKIPLNPLRLTVPGGSPFSAWGVSGWLSAFWVINYILLLFNLLPTFPMDGGRMLQVALWPRMGYRQATMTATFVGMIGAVIYGLVGLAFEQPLLLGIAVFGYLTCMRERMVAKSGMFDEEFGFGGFSEFGDSDSSASRQSWLAKRRARRAVARAEREQQREAELEHEIDAILQKVHDHGMHSLSPRERRILQEGTAKRRQGQP